MCDQLRYDALSCNGNTEIDTPHIEGRSLRPLMQNKNTPDNWREFAFAQLGRANMIRTRNWKLNIYNRVPGELYNLKKDPMEFYNLIATPAGKRKYRDKVEELTELFLAKHPDVYAQSEEILQADRRRENKMKPRVALVPVE